MLLVKEIKKTLFSITFVVFMTALLVMAVSQDVIDFSYDIITEPKLGEDYGIQQKEIPELIMPAAFSSLYNEFIANEYIAYPIGFYKNVKLSEADREKMAEIISVLSDVSVDDLLGYDVSSNTQDKMVITLDGSQNYAVQEDGSIIISKDDEVSEIKDNMEVTLSAEISYEEFKKCMKRADDIIGGGSNYSEDSLLRYSYVEDKVKVTDSTMEEKPKMKAGIIICIAGIISMVIWGLLSIFSPEASDQISDSSMMTIDGNGIFLMLCVVAIVVGAGLLLKNKKK